MVNIILSIIFFGLAFCLLSLKKSYKAYSLKEAKYLANTGDNLAKKIQKVIAYQESYGLLLIILIVIFLTLSLIFMKQLPEYQFILLSLVYLFSVFLIANSFKGFSKFLIILFSPILTFFLGYLHSSLKKVVEFLKLEKDRTPLVFDSIDLIKFLEYQSKKNGNRIDRDDLEFTKRALSLSETKVKDLCLKWSRVKRLKADEKIGPILLDELYKKKQPYVPIINEDKKVIGILNVNNLNLEQVGKVFEYKSPKLYFINEEDTIADLILAINKTSNEVFIVVDYASKYSGLISYLDIINLFKTDDQDNAKDYTLINS